MEIDVNQAKSLLLNGHVVAIPTETVYGLAAVANNEDAIKQIFILKGRPSINPLIVHVTNVEDAKRFCAYWPEGADILVEKFWPGPLTLVLPANPSNSLDIVRASLDTIAIRMPNHKIAKELIDSCGPLVAPSANLSTKPSITRPEHFSEDYDVLPFINGGECLNGLESTILGYIDHRWQLLRYGSLDVQLLQDALGYQVDTCKKPIAPGTFLKHYSPKAKLFVENIQDHEIILGFFGRDYPKAKQVIYLGDLLSPSSIANKLYETLRRLDREAIACVGVDIDFPSTGILKTIKERLIKASTQGE